MINNMEDKVYFVPGDLVTIRQEIPNKPIMLVVGKETIVFKMSEKSDQFKGMRCRWFTKDGFLQEAVFSTKDLIKI